MKIMVRGGGGGNLRMLHLVCDEMKRWCRLSLTAGSMSELIFLIGCIVCSLIPI